MRHRTALTQHPQTSTAAAQSPAQWPAWARIQLGEAVAIAEQFRSEPRATTLAGELYHEWFMPAVVQTPPELLRRPLAGLYRQAHVGSTRRVESDGFTTIDRRDAIGRDRWWRTWGSQWSPARGRTSGLRLLFSPDMNALPEFVHAATSTLLDVDEPWLLAFPTLPSRLRHSGSVVAYLPHEDDVRTKLVDALDPYVRPDTPPLCLPLNPGVALAEQPANGMTFGEHRCHLVALALERLEDGADPLRAIADMFAAHGIDPAEPFRGIVLG